LFPRGRVALDDAARTKVGKRFSTVFLRGENLYSSSDVSIEKRERERGLKNEN